MEESAEFKSTRVSNLILGVGLLVVAGSITWVIGFGSEAQLLQSSARKSGFLKLIEQAVGWEVFRFGAICFALWILVYSIVSLWKGIDATPDVTALPECILFHPAVRRSAASYDDVSHWSIEIVNRNPVLWIHFKESYWSLQGLFKRRTVKLEGSEAQLESLTDFFSNHAIMGPKLAA